MKRWPQFEEDEIAAVEAVLRSGKVNQWTGEQVTLFEKEFAVSHDCQYGVALANGTVALELALRVLGIGPGDEVITTPRTFVGTASAIVLCGATPVFADVDLVSQNITAETIEPLITRKTKAIIPVHLAGWPCAMDRIMEIAEKHHLFVIEDCAQAHGATYHGKRVGSFGHLGAFSFCQDKIMTTGGEGGMLTMNDESLWKKAWSFKDHGKDYDTVFHTAHPPGFRWLHASFGTNWRMTEMQAAIGRVQLTKLDRWLSHRRRNAMVLNQLFSQLPCARLTIPSAEIGHAYYKYYVFLEPGSTTELSRDEWVLQLNQQGIFCQTGSCSEIYREKCFESTQSIPSHRLPNAKQLGETSIAFLTDPTVTHVLSTCEELISTWV